MAVIPPLMIEISAAEISKLDLHEGDHLLLKVPVRLSPEQQNHLRACMEMRFPDHPCTILTEGITLEIVRPEVIIEEP